MIKALAVAGALLLIAGCTPRAKDTPLPEDAKIQTLIAKLESTMKCDPPRDSQTDRSVRVDCDSGKAFITVYPDAAGVHAELDRLTSMVVPPGNDYLVGDDGTWFAGGDADELEQLKASLGGRIQHIAYRPPTG